MEPEESPLRSSGSAPAEDVQLSVVIACYNAEDTLGVQLRALAAQDCPVPWELLLCDNGSTDRSVQLALGFRDRIPQLRVVDARARRGAGAARNVGVQQARGEWVAFCDADDEVAPDWLAAMCAALRQHRFVAGRFEQRRLNGVRVRRSRPMDQDEGLQSWNIGPRLPNAGAGNMGIHRADFLAVGGFDPQIRWLEDTDFSWRVQLAGVPLAFCPDAVVHVRLRDTFRGMFVQGRQYGLAEAMLEERYGGPDATPQPEATTPPEPEAAAGDRRPRWARVRSELIDHLVGGRLFWRAGWVVGHRGYRPGALGPPPAALHGSLPGSAPPA